MQPHHSNDEIDLVELARALWRQKLTILTVAAVVTAVAVAYALLATPYYQTKTLLRPVPPSGLDQLNETGIYKITPEEALSRVAGSLSSYENRLDFYRTHQSLFEGLEQFGDSAEQTFAKFNEEAFSMVYPDPKKSEPHAYIGLSLTYPKGLDGVEIVNSFVAYALQRERKNIADDLQSLIANRLASIDMQMAAGRARYEASTEAKIAALQEEAELARAELRDELAALRTELKARRLNRIQELQEAIAIADSLDIRTPTSPSAMADRRAGGQIIRTEVYNQGMPLYFLGTEALKAEQQALQQRTSDDFMEPRIAEIQKELVLLEHNREVELLKKREGDLYLEKLAEWRQEAARLNGIKLDADRLELVRIDQPALEPISPVKPKKTLIAALGLVLGLMLGVFSALVRIIARGGTGATARH